MYTIPCNPTSPLIPLSPLLPFGPFNPWSPFFPRLPVGPLGPGLPVHLHSLSVCLFASLCVWMVSSYTLYVCKQPAHYMNIFLYEWILICIVPPKHSLHTYSSLVATFTMCKFNIESKQQ